MLIQNILLFFFLFHIKDLLSYSNILLSLTGISCLVFDAIHHIFFPNIKDLFRQILLVFGSW